MRGRRGLLVLVAAVVVGALVFVALPQGRALLGQGVDWLRGSGVTGQLVALGLVLVGIPLGLPTLWMSALLGYLYGAAVGVTLAVPATTIGATLAFLLARGLLREEAAGFVAKRPRAQALIAAVGEGGARLVILLRLIGPHNLLNLSLAASPLRVRDFVVGTALGSAPTVCLAVVGGALAPNAAALWDARDRVWGWFLLVVAVGGAGMIAAIVMVRRATQRALARHLAAALAAGRAAPRP
jgi:uncharacterized membrane protein YdjX (TVP38/TMEM64 family)